MSTPAQLHPLLQPGPFRERLIVYLLPYFLQLTDNFDLARTEVMETLASYGARTRWEMINATRIIALSFTSLDVLVEAKADGIPYELRMRCRSSANALDRSCQQIEARFDKSLARDIPIPPEAETEPQPQPDPEAEPAYDIADTAFEAALLYVQTNIETHRNRLSAAHPATPPLAAFASPRYPAGQPPGSHDQPR